MADQFRTLASILSSSPRSCNPRFAGYRRSTFDLLISDKGRSGRSVTSERLRPGLASRFRGRSPALLSIPLSQVVFERKTRLQALRQAQRLLQDTAVELIEFIRIEMVVGRFVAANLRILVAQPHRLQEMEGACPRVRLGGRDADLGRPLGEALDRAGGGNPVASAKTRAASINSVVPLTLRSIVWGCASSLDTEKSRTMPSGGRLMSAFSASCRRKR